MNEQPENDPTEESVIYSIIGRVESIVDGSAYVLLAVDKKGERKEATCQADLLNKFGINAGDEFRCEVVKRDGATTTRFIRLPPKEISKEWADQIMREFKDRWSDL